MMTTRKTARSKLAEWICRKPGLVLILLPGLILVTLYITSRTDYEFGTAQYPSNRFYNSVEGPVEGYLVWNSKCHMLAKEPLDPSITKFVKKEKFGSCFSGKLLTYVAIEANGSAILYIDPEAATAHKNLNCCWSPVSRPKYTEHKNNFDSSIVVKHCEKFKNQLTIPEDVEVIMVSCNGGQQEKQKKKGKKSAVKPLYKNVHAILNPEKVRERLEYNISQVTECSRKLSVLILGIDSVSRLNLKRTLPKTEQFLNDTGWVEMKGYNKMGDNTFPNLMAMLTGQNQQQAYTRCKPTEAFYLDRCPLIWYSFRNAGYVTAYGEDETKINTFNYLKVGFVEPPTDYYLRPYMLASEKLLTSQTKFQLSYCTGPMTSFDRIFDYGLEFASAFLGLPYFGFFWTNTMSHDNVNGLSSVDARILKKFKYLENQGVLNDSMVVFVSDHGMRFGPIRNTFMGWYEERLPFLYIWLPPWFRSENPDAYRALRVNANRFTSPFDVYETLRDILISAGGSVNASSGCSTCQTLFELVPQERGCEDAGVAPHWCVCTAFEKMSTSDTVMVTGALKFVEHMENIVKTYKDKRGKRLCSKLRLKKIHSVNRVIDFGSEDSSTVAYFYMLQVSPGDGKFEVTIRHYGNGNYTISDEEVSRINHYGASARCLKSGMKQYCHCSA